MELDDILEMTEEEVLDRFRRVFGREITDEERKALMVLSKKLSPPPPKP